MIDCLATLLFYPVPGRGVTSGDGLDRTSELRTDCAVTAK